MPTLAESLRVTSSNQERNAAVSDCVSQIKAERPGISDEQAQAICISMADRAMGTMEHKSSRSNPSQV